MGENREDVLRIIALDRVRAHAVLFRHRHPSASPSFHTEIINLFHSKNRRIVVEAFRGGAKSTLAEETIILKAALLETKNALIIGASYERAVERLESIGHELETNEDILGTFENLRGTTTWTESKKVLSNGVILQAKGAGQSLRGTKYHDLRPDLALIDDLEDEESVRTPESRREKLRWLEKVLIPALTPNAQVIFIGNRLDPECVLATLAKDPEWKHLRFPIMYQDLDSGEDVAAWPSQFSLEWIYQKRESMQRRGLFEDFNQEYMCSADTPEERIFRPEHFVINARVRTWQATWCMVDPARSINKRSASTALPIWSWINNRLVVWDCLIGHWLPDEIIQKMLDVDREYRPVAIGVEEDALNQFILQPLRQAQVKHGHPLPIRAMSAKRYTEGRGKLDFIKSLQPFFAAHEIEFAKDLPELKSQFLSFPKGLIDGPNALAYALKLRPGYPVYDEFSAQNVVDELTPANRPIFLVLNATRTYVTAIVVQFDGITLNVLSDLVEEGDPGQMAAGVVRRAQLELLGKPIRLVAPPSHFDQWSNVGLRASVAKVPAEVSRGGDFLTGREEIRRLLRTTVRGVASVQVSGAARWTLNAFSGGYARALQKGGVMSEETETGAYRTLMEGLESFAAMMAVNTTDQQDRDGANYVETADGRRYISAMVRRS